MSKKNRNNKPNQQPNVDDKPKTQDKSQTPKEVEGNKQQKLEKDIVKEAVELAHHRVMNIVKLKNMALEWETLSTN